jgi:hypothetical protein
MLTSAALGPWRARALESSGPQGRSARAGSRCARDGLLALGAPSARGVKWCRAALEYLIEIDSWAPEIDRDSTLPAVLQFSRRTDARWAVHAAQVAGLQTSRVEAPGELFRVRVE